jgi:hypothetical protein
MISQTLEEHIEAINKINNQKIDELIDKLGEVRKPADKAIESLHKEQELLDKLKDRNDRMF